MKQALKALEGEISKLRVLAQAGECKCVISNLINNSVEALGDTGHIMVSLTGNDGHIQRRQKEWLRPDRDTPNSKERHFSNESI